MFKARYVVVEYATLLEEISSYCLCELLDIDQNESISFSYKSQALSFNSKINLISDIAGTDKLIKSKFQIFSEIRNKFAHVFSISSFTALCSLDAELKKSCKKLLDWYIKEEFDQDQDGHPKNDIIYIASFIHLFKELEAYILKIAAMNQEKKGYETGKVDFLINFQDSITKELYKSDEGLKILGDYLETLK